MGEKVKLSIIIPVYNSEKYINNILDDILAQSYTDFEVIVINDGSNDGSQDILEQYARRDPRIHVTKVKGSGVSEARNIGVSLAKGKYIRFIDADDRIDRDSILYMMNVVEKDESVDLVIGSFRSMPESNLYYGEHAISGKQNLKQMSLDFLFNIRSFYYGVVWNKLYKRQIIQQNNIKFNREIPWCEDFFFNLQYYKCCDWFYFLPVNKLVYDYIQHASSTTKTIHRLPKGQVKKINELRTQATKEFFEEMGLSDILRLEWKYSFIFSNLFDLAKGKKKSIKEKYKKVKDTFEQEGVCEYIKLKKDYFSDDSFYKFAYFTAKSKWYIPMYIYIHVYAWFAKNMNWVKYIWKKIGGKRPKVL